MKGYIPKNRPEVSKVAKTALQRGFTLMEMMVVVAIIAVIATIIALNYAHSKSNAQVSATEANMKQIATGLELYYADTQQYPASGAVGSAMFGGAGNHYLNSSPNSPGPGGGAYTLAVSGQSYTISDPATYDSASLGMLPKGNTPSGVAPTISGSCGAGCTHMSYSNASGLFGYP
jgi:prepilin-type N-terminal cleavage/methylation domain-containing protein